MSNSDRSIGWCSGPGPGLLDEAIAVLIVETRAAFAVDECVAIVGLPSRQERVCVDVMASGHPLGSPDRVSSQTGDRFRSTGVMWGPAGKGG
jgi:hypothetical protein